MTDQSPVLSPGRTLSVPVAIVIAGALIALAIYFSNSAASRNTQTTGTNPTTAQQGAAPTALPIGDPRPIDEAKDHIRGPKNAKITIIEYSDLECPFCKQFHTTMKQVLAAYPNDVRWVYRHAPLSQLHSKAPAEANAAECANEQGKFWEFVDKVFEVTPANNGLDAAQIPTLAQQAGVADIAKFKTCVDSGKYNDLVQADLDDATKAGMRGTPYSVVLGPNDQKTSINGAYPLDSVKATIDGLLK